MLTKWQTLVEEAKSLGVHYPGLLEDQLEQRIEDKKNNTGIYADSVINPDASIEELWEKALELGIDPAFKSQPTLVTLINKKSK